MAITQSSPNDMTLRQLARHITLASCTHESGHHCPTCAEQHLATFRIRCAEAARRTAQRMSVEELYLTGKPGEAAQQIADAVHDVGRPRACCPKSMMIKGRCCLEEDHAGACR